MKQYIFLVLILLLNINLINSFDFIDENQNQINLNDPTVIETSNGYVKGNLNEKYMSFYGIPFAQPPVNNLRWQSPADTVDWAPKVLDARYPQFGCPQICELPPGTCPTNTSEDCLYLNVFTPIQQDTPTQSLRPVMAFLPGGRFEQGAASSPLYNAETMVNSSNAIVVTINYRLGVLGFLLTDDFQGNYGFQDQRQALIWIQNNIKYFGGDPNQVTLVGQSAGATSIAAHLTSQLSWNLFHKAVIQSDPFTLGLKTKEIAQMYSIQFTQAVQCSFDDVKCLLALDVNTILDGQVKAQQGINPLLPLASFLPWTPTVGGSDILDQPYSLIQKNQFYDVPLIVGTVSEEALLFIYQAATKNVTGFEYEVVLDLIFTKNAEKVNQWYPANMTSDNRPNLSVLGTDYIFVCSTRSVVNYLSQFKSTPTYYYQFSHVISVDVWGPNYPNCVGHCCHGSELPFVFNTATSTGYIITPQEQELSYNMNNYWMNFVVNSNPNIGLSIPVEWPTYNTTDKMNINFQTPPFVESNLLNSNCNFFDSIGYNSK